MFHSSIPRRTFTLGAATGSGRREPFFDETTLWDSEVDPMVNYHVHGLTVLPDDTILVATEWRHEFPIVPEQRLPAGIAIHSTT